MTPTPPGATTPPDPADAAQRMSSRDMRPRRQKPGANTAQAHFPQPSQPSFLQQLVDSGRLRPTEAATLGQEVDELYPEGIVTLMMEKGLLDEQSAYRALADFYGYPYINLTATTIEPSAIASLSGATARELEVLPFFLYENELSVALPFINLDIIDRIREETGCELLIHLASRNRIREALEIHYPSVSMAEVEADMHKRIDRALDQNSEGARLFAKALVREAAKAGASDIHIEPAEKVARIRHRVDGVLRETIRIPLSMHTQLVALFKVMAQLNIAENRRPQDGRISFALETHSFDLRLSFVPALHGEKLAIRLLDRQEATSDLATLAFATVVGQRLYRVIAAPNGIVFVTGPTGSGKTTTCYAILNHLNRIERNIVTIEDPVEYRLPGITQLQVNHSIGLGFGPLLRSVLRQDPDIVFVGEIRDVETARIATQAALTGHLVISTLHTNDAVQAVVRLIEMGVDPFMVAPSVTAVLAQRLVRRICEHCGEAYEPTADDRTLFGAGPQDRFTLRRGTGCIDCAGTGYRGRIGVHEIVVVNDVMRELILRQAPLLDLEKAAYATGFRSMRHDALKKALLGLTTTEETRRVTTAREDFVFSATT